MPSDMTIREAIARIQNHKIIHKMNEPRAIYISKALDMATNALELVEYIEQRYEKECNDRREHYADGSYHGLSMSDGASYVLGQVLDKWKESNEERQPVDDAMDAYTLDYDNYDIDYCQ